MDHSTTSISEARITLRDDLRFRTQQFRGKTCYVIEDPTSSSYYRVGEAEYTLISLFDGHRSLGEVLQAASSVLGRKAFTEQDAAVIAKWLVEAGLAKTQTVGEVARLHRKAGEKKKRSTEATLESYHYQVSLVSPGTDARSLRAMVFLDHHSRCFPDLVHDGVGRSFSIA